MPVPNLPSIVAVTDTFEEWRLKTNSIITALTNDTILLTELPSIAANTILGNSSLTAAATPNTITVLSSNGINMIDGVLKLVTPSSIGGITMSTGGALSLATTVAGAGLALNSGVLSIPLTTTGTGTPPTANSGLKFVTAAVASGSSAQINAGLGVSLLANGGITLTGGALALAATVAGAGLALNSGVLSALSIPLTTVGGFNTQTITGTNMANSPIITLTVAISSLTIMASFIGRGITGNTTGSGIPSLTYITAISGISIGNTVTLSANITIANTARLFYVYLFNNSSGLKFVAASTGDLIPEIQMTAGLGIKVNSDKGLEIVDAGLGIKVINGSSLIVNNMGISINLIELSLIVRAIITNNKVTYTSNTWGLVDPGNSDTQLWLGNLVGNRRGRNLSPYSTVLLSSNAGIVWTRSVSGGIAPPLTGPGFVIACMTNAPKIAITIGFSGRARGGNHNNNFGYLYLSRIIYTPNNVILDNHSGLGINGSEGFYQINENSGAYYETTIYDILPATAVIGSSVLYILSYLADNAGWNLNETDDGQRGFHLFDSNRNQSSLRQDNTAIKRLSFIMLEIPTVNVT